MLLRVLALLAIAAAAARPVARWVGAGHAPTAIAIVIDNSLSSSAVVERPAAARSVQGDGARRRVGASTSADRLWLVTIDGRVRGGSAATLRDEINRLEPIAGAGDPAAALVARGGRRARRGSRRAAGRARDRRPAHRVAARAGDRRRAARALRAARSRRRRTARSCSPRRGRCAGRRAARSRRAFSRATRRRIASRSTDARSRAARRRRTRKSSCAPRRPSAGGSPAPSSSSPTSWPGDNVRHFAVWIGPAPGRRGVAVGGTVREERGRRAAHDRARDRRARHRRRRRPTKCRRCPRSSPRRSIPCASAPRIARSSAREFRGASARAAPAKRRCAAPELDGVTVDDALRSRRADRARRRRRSPSSAATRGSSPGRATCSSDRRSRPTRRICPCAPASFRGSATCSRASRRRAGAGDRRARRAHSCRVRAGRTRSRAPTASARRSPRRSTRRRAAAYVLSHCAAAGASARSSSIRRPTSRCSIATPPTSSRDRLQSERTLVARERVVVGDDGVSRRRARSLLEPALIAALALLIVGGDRHRSPQPPSGLMALDALLDAIERLPAFHARAQHAPAAGGAARRRRAARVGGRGARRRAGAPAADALLRRRRRRRRRSGAMARRPRRRCVADDADRALSGARRLRRSRAAHGGRGRARRDARAADARRAAHSAHDGARAAREDAHAARAAGAARRAAQGRHASARASSRSTSSASASSACRWSRTSRSSAFAAASSTCTRSAWPSRCAPSSGATRSSISGTSISRRSARARRRLSRSCCRSTDSVQRGRGRVRARVDPVALSAGHAARHPARLAPRARAASARGTTRSTTSTSRAAAARTCRARDELFESPDDDARGADAASARSPTPSGARRVAGRRLSAASARADRPRHQAAAPPRARRHADDHPLRQRGAGRASRRAAERATIAVRRRRRCRSACSTAASSSPGGDGCSGLRILTDHEIFRRERRIRRARRYITATALDTMSLKPGDFVVHLEHGVGIYRGIETIFVGQSTIEVAVVEYEGGDRLNVPLYRIDQLERYRSGDDVSEDSPPPRLHKLGGDAGRSSASARAWRSRR